jgi:hypothetical protein
MKFRIRRLSLVLSIAAASALAVPQRGGTGGTQDSAAPASSPGRDDNLRLPNGKLQRDEILKQEHEQNVKDAAQLVEFAQQLQLDIEKSDRFVLSISTLKKTEEIEKLAKKIRSRLHH